MQLSIGFVFQTVPSINQEYTGCNGAILSPARPLSGPPIERPTHWAAHPLSGPPIDRSTHGSDRDLDLTKMHCTIACCHGKRLSLIYQRIGPLLCLNGWWHGGMATATNKGIHSYESYITGNVHREHPTMGHVAFARVWPRLVVVYNHWDAVYM